MRTGSYYLSISLVFLFAGFYSKNLLLSGMLYWISLSVAAVAFAYLFNSASIFRKTYEGRIPLYIRWVFIPFLVSSHIYNYWQRRKHQNNNIQPITDSLYVAGRLLPSDVDILQQQNIGAVLDVTAEFDALNTTLNHSHINYLNVPILDHAIPSRENLKKSLHWISDQHQQGKRVLVHCALGRGRSVLIIIAYLLATKTYKNVAEAIDNIRQIRPLSGLNRRQLHFIVKMQKEKQLLLKNRACLIVNPVAGGGKWQQNEHDIVTALSPYFTISIKKTTKEISARSLSQEAIDEGCDLLIACGGDGTLTEVAATIINTNIIFGMIPLGTANALCHALYGIQTKVAPISTALNIITCGDTKTIDTATCNGKPQLLVCALGFEATMINYADRSEKDNLGQLAYLQGFWSAVSSNEILQLTIQCDDEPPQKLNTPSLVVANASPFSSILSQGKGCPDYTDGYLDVTWLEPAIDSGEQLASLASLLSNQWLKKTSDKVHHKLIKKIVISSDNMDLDNLGLNNVDLDNIAADKTTNYVIDGETENGLPLTIEVAPKSLKVLVAADSD